MAKFDVDADLVRKLADLLAESDLSEIEYQVGEQRIRVARGRAEAVPSVTVAPAAAATAPAPEAKPAASSDVPHPDAVTAPMVGTVYLTPEPGEPPFVKAGDQVNEGQTLLIIEAMKVMNQIRAPRSGTVTAVLVEGGQPVEYGEPLLVLQ